jgi:hypothetical protein
VCAFEREVGQVLLLAVAEVKSEEGHRRYVEFRNIRGE